MVREPDPQITQTSQVVLPKLRNLRNLWMLQSGPTAATKQPVCRAQILTSAFDSRYCRKGRRYFFRIPGELQRPGRKLLANDAPQDSLQETTGPARLFRLV